MLERSIIYACNLFVAPAYRTTAAAHQTCLNSSSLFETMACFSHYAQVVPKLFGSWRRNWLFIASMSDVVGVRGRHFLRLLGFDVDCVEWNMISE
jgi:NO-binding membrane sensor protein with MHYT domain